MIRTIMILTHTTANSSAMATRTITFDSPLQMWAVLHQIAITRGVNLRWDQPLSLAGEHLITIHLTFSTALLEELNETLLLEHSAEIELDAIIDAMVAEAARHVSPTLELVSRRPTQLAG